MRRLKILIALALVFGVADFGAVAAATAQRRRRSTRRARPTRTVAPAAAASAFVIPDGTRLVADLNENLSSKQARPRDRFTLTVREPSEYAGATIEGYVSTVKRSGRVTGRSQMTLNFDRIRLRDGGSRRFAGTLESIRTPNGETIRTDTEGSVKDENQTEKTAKRSAIGAGAGALIGAIAGGGKGAAIGAILGAGGGAGSVYVQGRDDLDLASGSEFVIRASGPNRDR